MSKGKLTKAQSETLRVMNIPDLWILQRDADSEFSRTFRSLVKRGHLQVRKDYAGRNEVSITEAGRKALESEHD